MSHDDWGIERWQLYVYRQANIFTYVWMHTYRQTKQAKPSFQLLSPDSVILDGLDSTGISGYDAPLMDHEGGGSSSGSQLSQELNMEEEEEACMFLRACAFVISM